MSSESQSVRGGGVATVRDGRAGEAWPMSVEIRQVPADDAEAVATYCAIRATVYPDEADTPEGVAWAEATYPGEEWRLLALLDGQAVGAATVGRLYIRPPDFPQFFYGFWVLEHDRGRGVETALYREASRIARAAGKTGLRNWVSEAHTEVVAFLRDAGFVEEHRTKAVSLDLRPLRAATGPDGAGTGDSFDAQPPEGFDIVTLADRPDLVAGVHAAAVEAYPSIPSTPPMDPGPLEMFKARDVYRDGIPLEGFFVAVERSTGEVAGYANLIFLAGSTTIALHDMTAVRPAFRGRGIALALKRMTIAWAIRAGLDELRASNDEENAPMRGINARLGYRPLPDEIGFEGPLAPEDERASSSRGPL